MEIAEVDCLEDVLNHLIDREVLVSIENSTYTGKLVTWGWAGNKIAVAIKNGSVSLLVGVGRVEET